MTTWIVEDQSGQQYEVEATSAKDAVASICADAAAVDYLYTDNDDVKWYAAFDEDGNGIDDLQCWEAMDAD